jgi:hypothetical protein
MKRYLIIAMMCLTGLTIQAQTKVLINLTDGTTKEYEVEQVDSMIWDKITIGTEVIDGLVIYLNGKTKVEYAVGMIEDIKWDKKSTGNQTIVKNDILLANPEIFYVNDEFPEVKGKYCAVDLCSVVTENDTKLAIREAVNPQVLEDAIDEEIDDEPYKIGRNARVIDLDLEGIHELDGIAVIRIPFTPTNGKLPGAAYYNENTKAWEPICSYYDYENNEVVIITSHLSMFSAFDVEDEHTRKAKLEFVTMPVEEKVSPMSLGQLLLKANEKAVEWMDDVYSKLPTLELDLGYNLIQTAGFSQELLEKSNEYLGKLGVYFSVYEICRSAMEGKNDEAGKKTLEMLASDISGAMVSTFVKSSLASATSFSLAFIGYALNQMYESAISDREDIYRRCYDLYYSKYNRRSSPDWYKLIMPIYENPNSTIESVKADVEKLVDDYVWELWYKTDDELAILWQEVGGPNGSFKGFLSASLQQELSNNYKGIIYRDILPVINNVISNKIYEKNYDQLKKEFMDYANHMNRVIVVTIRDALAFNESEYAGCKVRFKNLPNTLKDPDDWECTLDEKGNGKIRFRLYAYTKEGVKPTLEIVRMNAGKEEVVKEITFSLSADNSQNIIDLNEGVQSGFVLREFTKQERKYTYTEYTGPSYLRDAGLDDPCPYVEIVTFFEDKDWPLCSLALTPEDLDKGIKEAFEKYGNFTYGEGGGFGVSNDVLTVAGTFIPKVNQTVPNSGSGTFKIGYTHILNIKTVNEVTSFWRNPSNFRNPSSRFMDFNNPLLNGEMKQTIEGTFTFEWNDEKNGYIFKFTGKGPFSLAGVVYNRIDGVDPVYGGGFNRNNINAVCSNTEDTVIGGETEINFEMFYEMINTSSGNEE